MASVKSTGATHATQPETTWQNISFLPNSGSLLSATPSNWETTLQSSQKTPKTSPLHHSSRPTASNQTTETYFLSSPLPMSKFTNPQQETHSLRKPSKQLLSATMTNLMVSSSTIQQQNNFSDPAIRFDPSHPSGAVFGLAYNGGLDFSLFQDFSPGHASCIRSATVTFPFTHLS